MIQRYILLAFALVAVACSAAAGVTGTIVGRVVDADGKPVVGATVRVLSTVRGANSKADGRYAIVNLAAGCYKIQCTFVGSDTAIKNIVVNADQTATLDFTLSDKFSGVANAPWCLGVASRTAIDSNRSLDNRALTTATRNNTMAMLDLQGCATVSGPGVSIRCGRRDVPPASIDALEVFPMSTIAADDLHEQTTVAIAPNPSSVAAILTIDTDVQGVMTVAVVNALGDVVLRMQSPDASGRWVTSIPTQTLATGAYHCLIQQGPSIITRVLHVQH